MSARKPYADDEQIPPEANTTNNVIGWYGDPDDPEPMLESELAPPTDWDDLFQAGVA